jgi:tetratricopeptide (TPR) repeat protein
MNKGITLTTSYLKECFKQARYYEFCKDSDRALTVLKPIWSNFEEAPAIDGLSERDAWEVLLICGSVISAHGSTHQKKHYHELATDMLTRARDLALSIGERELIAESEKQIGTAYWRNGQFDNAIAFLNTALSKYSEAEQLTNKICLLTQSNLLTLYVRTNKHETAFKVFEKLKPFVDETDDLQIKTVFYNQSAGVFVAAGKFAHAIPLLEKAVEYSTGAKNDTYLGGNLNNLANAYINLPVPDVKSAMKYADQAIKLFLSINQLFSYAVALETKAVIFAKMGDYNKALLTIGESIKFLQKGENYMELCESLWTRTEFLIETGETIQAIRQFNELLNIANERLNLISGDKYIERLNKLLYLTTGSNFEEKETNFRAHLLDEALAACGGIVTATANYLGIIHQTLSNILKKFPALVEKHQVKLRTRTATGTKTLEKNSETEISAGEETTSFAVRINNNRLEYLGLKKGQMVGVNRRELDELDLSKPVVIKDAEQKYFCGFLVDALGMFAFEDGRGNMERIFLPSEIIDCGQVLSVYDPKSEDFIPLKFWADV